MKPQLKTSKEMNKDYSLWNSIIEKKYFFCVLAISLVSHLLFFGYPEDVVFDEVFYGKHAQYYFTGDYYFDVHPPLGNLLIAGVGKIMGYNHFHDYNGPDRRYATNDYIIFRMLPLTLGIFLGPLIYLIARKLLFSENAATLVGIFCSMDSALITESRYILINIILIFFGFLSVYYLLKYRDDFSKKSIAAAGFFAACSASIKWTGLGFLGLTIVFYVYLFFKSDKEKNNPLFGVLFLILMPLALYFFFFAVHFQILKKTGAGIYQHTPAFQKTFSGSSHENNSKIIPLGILGKIVEENIAMLRDDKNKPPTHDYSSKWYSWPSLGKTILYWGSSQGEKPAEIRLIGNPVIWWSGFLSVVIIFATTAMAHFWRKFRSKIKDSGNRIEFTPLFIVSGFLINYIPFIFIHRYMFAYHYLSALIFSILALGYVVNKIKNNKKILFFLYLEVILFFLVLFPLTYGVSIF